MYSLLSFNIKKICITFLYWWSVFLNFFKPSNNEIEKVSLEYTLSDHSVTAPSKNIFWKNEMKYWTKHSNEYWSDITRYYNPESFKKLIKKMPLNIKNHILRIKYHYNDKVYTFVTHNPTKYEWPPPNHRGLTFAMPIDKAYILDKLGNEIALVTKKVKKCAGPKFNFHNQKIQVKDMFDYEHEKCKITYIDGTSKIYNFDEYLN